MDRASLTLTNSLNIDDDSINQSKINNYLINTDKSSLNISNETSQSKFIFTTSFILGFINGGFNG